jgi:hypothetical protein
MKLVLYILGAIVAAPIALLVAVQLFCTIAFEWLDLFGGKLPAWTGASQN